MTPRERQQAEATAHAAWKRAVNRDKGDPSARSVQAAKTGAAFKAAQAARVARMNDPKAALPVGIRPTAHAIEREKRSGFFAAALMATPKKLAERAARRAVLK